MPIVYRVHARKAGYPDRTITVSDDGTVSCDCDGFAGVYRNTNPKFCSHIDATLIANERAMVPEADREAADRAEALVSGTLRQPEDWKASWSRDLKWRGISRNRATVNRRTSGKPLVCFTGKFTSRDRKVLIAEAQIMGWDTTDSPSRFTDVLVKGALPKPSSKVETARKFSTPIVSEDEWLLLMHDGVLPA